MLTKLFWALLAISLTLSFIYRDKLQSIYKNNFVNKYIKSPTDANAGDSSDIKDYDIVNLTLATSSSITLKDKEYIYTFIKRLESNDMQNIDTVKKGENEMGKKLKVMSVYFDIYKDAYLHMEKGEIRINIYNDLDTVWNDYLSAIGDNKLSYILKNERDNLDYLDLRFPNKLFYKFKTYDQRILGTSTISSSTAQ